MRRKYLSDRLNNSPDGYGPKYQAESSDTSTLLYRSKNTLGKSSLVILIIRNDLSSLSLTLYRGFNFPIRSASSITASISLPVSTTLISTACRTIISIAGPRPISLAKYDFNRFCKFFALPTYKISPSKPINWYIPGVLPIFLIFSLNSSIE
ncbi:MAG: hypothetical protein BWY68_00868 [bacterium ADurb.Bin400]|nr:MAG: hypothetical protein BWY68_00868 [bacterium ADurb.Bin400]